MEHNLDEPTKQLQGTLAMWLQERLQSTLQMPEDGSLVYSFAFNMQLDYNKLLCVLVTWTS